MSDIGDRLMAIQLRRQQQDKVEEEAAEEAHRAEQEEKLEQWVKVRNELPNEFALISAINKTMGKPQAIAIKDDQGEQVFKTGEFDKRNRKTLDPEKFKNFRRITCGVKFKNMWKHKQFFYTRRDQGK